MLLVTSAVMMMTAPYQGDIQFDRIKNDGRQAACYSALSEDISTLGVGVLLVSLLPLMIISERPFSIVAQFMTRHSALLAISTILTIARAVLPAISNEQKG